MASKQASHRSQSKSVAKQQIDTLRLAGAFLAIGMLISTFL